MSTKYRLRITGECKQNMKLCKRRGLPHIQPNWLLVWEVRNQELILVLLNTGTHSDLFSKKYKKR